MLERGSRLAAYAEWAGVTRVANVTGLDRIGVPVVSAVRPRSRTVSVSFGKGRTREDAVASAVHEACELHAAEDWQGEIAWMRHRDMPEDETYPLASLPRFRDGASCDFIARLQLPWVRGRRLSDGAPMWLPLELVGFSQEVPPRPSFGHFAATATGLGAGPDPGTAQLHGLCEVIERACFADWRALDSGGRAATFVDLQSIDAPPLLDLAARIARCGLSLLVFDMTNRLQVPCFLAEIFDFDETGGEAPYAQGLAASPDPHVALEKAIVEAAQARLTFISGARDDLDWHDYWPGADELRGNRFAFARDCKPQARFSARRAKGPHAPVSLSALLEELPGAAAFTWSGDAPAGLSICKILALDLEDGLDADPHFVRQQPCHDAHAW